MGRFERSMNLAKASWVVLKGERELAWFPVLSMVTSLAVAGVFALGIWATIGKETGVDGQVSHSPNVATFLLIFCLYIALAFVQTYFLAGLCAGANERLQGRPTSVGTALAVANTRLHRILPWAVLSATVTIVMQAIENRAGILGRIVVSLLNFAWTVLTFLVVPVIVFEDLGAIDALKRSGTLLKQTWGENVIAQIGLGVLGFVVAIPAMLLFVLGTAAGGVFIVVGIALGVIVLVVGSVILNALSGIYRTALYRYAVDGRVPDAFAGADLENAFGPRRSSGRSGFGGTGFGGTGGFGGGFVE
jgi:Family of unknown function (DUF6159)